MKITEERLQEELHVDQAVHDIVRLIKQDPRTALLIVQLLRKYQLERTQAEMAAATAEQTEEEVTRILWHVDKLYFKIEMSSVENPRKQDSVQSEISERKSSFGSVTSTSSSACHDGYMESGTTRTINNHNGCAQMQTTVYYAEP